MPAITDLIRQFEEKIVTTDPAEEVDNALVNIPSTSREFALNTGPLEVKLDSERQRPPHELYAQLLFNESQKSFKKTEESTVYAEVSINPQKYRVAADQLQQDLQSTYAKIEELEKKIQHGFQTG